MIDSEFQRSCIFCQWSMPH